MEVKPGYKQTEVGVIPEDWEVKRLGEVACFLKGKGLPKSDISESGKHPCIHYGELFTVYGETIGDVRSRTDCIDGMFRSVANDVLMPTSDVTPRGLAKASCIGIDGVILGGDILIIRIASKLVYGSYLSLVIRYEESQVLQLVTGTTVYHLYGSDMEKFTFPLPPLPEQKAIAKALSDMDSLLSGLDSLIAKKRDIKQATMQQLLTGKTRLPGFSGEWEVKRLANNASLKARIGWQGLTTAEYRTAGTHLLVTGTDFIAGKVNWSGCFYVDVERYTQDKHIQLQCKDVLVTKDGTIGKVAFVDVLPMDATLNSGVFVIRPKGNAFDPRFFYYILSSSIFDDFLTKLAAGSTISHLYQKDFVTFTYHAPESLPEQQAIAKVLTDMDAELEALEQRRDKTRELKQAMIQELLTGRTRLV